MSSIAAGTTSGTALVSTGDTTGALVLKTGSSAITALTIDTLQNVGIGTTPVTWSTQVEALQIGPHAAYYSNTVDTTTVVSNNLYVSAGGSNTYSNTGAVAQFYQVNGQHVWRSAASGTAGTTVALTQVLAVEKDRSLALQGATTQTGAGISFPATQVASSDANTLDDYEEGTWTPNLGGTETGTFSGTYTKIGRYVIAAFTINVTLIGTGSTSQISGLPFSMGSVGTQTGSVSYFDTTLSTNVLLMLRMDSGTTIKVGGIGAASASITGAYGVFKNGATLVGNVSYFTS